MKKVSFCLLALFLILSSCEKDKVTQLSFSLKNLSSLLDKSSDHVKKASPGDLYLNETDYTIYKITGAISGMDKNYLYYNFVDDRCDYVIILPEGSNSLPDSELFMNLAETEIGEAEGYYVAYYDAQLQSQEEEFSSLDELWTFIDVEGITVDKVDELLGMYFYEDFYIMAGGFYEQTSKDFQSMIQIGKQEDLTGKKNFSLKAF